MYSSKPADMLNGRVITTPSLQDVVERYPGGQKPDRYVYLNASNSFAGSHFDMAIIDFDIEVEEARAEATDVFAEELALADQEDLRVPPAPVEESFVVSELPNSFHVSEVSRDSSQLNPKTTEIIPNKFDETKSQKLVEDFVKKMDTIHSKYQGIAKTNKSPQHMQRDLDRKDFL